VEERLHAFLTMALDGGEWPATRSGCLAPGKWQYPLQEKLGRSYSRSDC
jgi:hypothetical protein